MEYILADALQKGSTSTLYFHSLLLKEVEVLISVGSFQSNHARTVAIIAASRGIFY
jgi:1-aminocyclopropane-1-carboxylate deaminase/D-cysteine desulfhydrase-like pyridoxal-dependent ACC family enzyme